MDDTEYAKRLRDFLSLFDADNLVLVVGEGETTAGEVIEQIDEFLDNPFGEFEDERDETRMPETDDRSDRIESGGLD